MKLLLTSTVELFAPKLPLIFGDKLKDMTVLYIPTAAYAEGSYEPWLMPELNAVKHQVKSLIEFDIKGASQIDLIKALEGVDILYVTGGNTFCLLEAMQDINFQDVLGALFNQGGVYMGSSAGSIVVCPDIEFTREIDDSSKANLKSTAGYNLIDFSIMPHINQPKFNDLFEATLNGANKDKKILGLRDDQAVWVENNYMRLY